MTVVGKIPQLISLLLALDEGVLCYYDAATGLYKYNIILCVYMTEEQINRLHITAKRNTRIASIQQIQN
jgi:hypothetical protein